MMMTIGVVQEPTATETIQALWLLFHDASPTETAIFVDLLDTSLDYAQKEYDIVIANEINPKIKQNLFLIKNNYTLILNSDNEIQYALLSGLNASLITFGFNSKASVTCSSVLDNEYKSIQVCIQRGFATQSHKTQLPQEFSVHLRERIGNVHSVLAATTALLLADIDLANPVRKNRF